MKISVVIPLYNKEPYVRRAIESVLMQELSPAEILVVDDGSTDNSAQVVKSIQDSRIRLVNQPNGGECAARNLGISAANGNYIAFLDADDEWKPDFLKRIQRLVINFPNCGAYATSAQVIRPDHSIGYPRLVNIPTEPWMGVIPNFFELFQAGNAFNASSIVVPKPILEKVGGFPVGVNVSGDVACWVNIALDYPIAFDPAPAAIYHQDAQNRVGHIYKPIKEMPYIQSILGAVNNERLAKKFQVEALEFVAQKQIFVAVENIMTGNPAYARQLLISCRKTKKYKQVWLWWMIWTCLPAGWPNKLQHLKQKVVGA